MAEFLDRLMAEGRAAAVLAGTVRPAQRWREQVRFGVAVLALKVCAPRSEKEPF